MKKIIGVLIMYLTIGQNLYAQVPKKADLQAYTLIVDVSAIKPRPETVYFMCFYMTPNGFGSKSDSLEVINGKAIAKGTVAEPSLTILQTKLMGVSSRFMLAPGTTIVKAGKDISVINVIGKPYQNEVEKLYQLQKEYEKNILEPIALDYKKLMDKKDSVAAKSEVSEFSAAQLHAADTWKAYAVKNAKTSPLSVFALKFAADSGLPGIDSAFDLLAPAYKKTPTALSIKAKLDTRRMLAIGQQAPLFSQPDTSGKPVSLDSFKGKYLLVDFWASWCHPCREESPFLISAYQRFHTRNFEILSVSLDSESGKTAWLKAIHDDKVAAWTQVSDLKGWKNAASVLYGINSIPQNYLLDPSGKIIATDLRGGELEKKLNAVLN